MKLLVVVLNYRGTDLTVDCLRTLDGRIDRVPGAKVVVVENGSGGDAEERLRREIDEKGYGRWAELLPVHPNRGFTGGNNIAIRRALASGDPPEYVLLLNNDTLVHDGALEALVAFMDAHPEAGIAGSQLLWPDGRIQASPFRHWSFVSEFIMGVRLTVVHRLLSRWWIVPPTPAAASPVDWVSGASMILRRTMLDRIGLLDEGLYTYFDDNDICLRAHGAGWQVWYVPESRITHLEGATTGLAQRSAKRRPPYWFQARRRFFLKHHGAAYAALADAAWILGFSLWRARRFVQRRPDTDPPHLLADFVRESVFRTGFELREVENPAMPKGGGATAP